MNSQRFDEYQIAETLKQVEKRRAAGAACREFGIPEKQYRSWKVKYAGLDPADIRRQRDLEARLRRISLEFAEWVKAAQVGG